MDTETMVKEDLSALKASNLVIQQQTSRAHRNEYLVEKDRIESSRESQKVMRLQVQDNVQLNKLLGSHRNQVKLHLVNFCRPGCKSDPKRLAQTSDCECGNW